MYPVPRANGGSEPLVDDQQPQREGNRRDLEWFQVLYRQRRRLRLPVGGLLACDQALPEKPGREDDQGGLAVQGNESRLLHEKQQCAQQQAERDVHGERVSAERRD